ncbi:hypothetical protein PUN28_010041 [Cardiocondyla obscurior]|uniref:Uncharacterized protein n=1 Tax=Cardiocondyla obscurior TaxID=286306 RepID=A0AAW2FSL8_9HYME
MCHAKTVLILFLLRRGFTFLFSTIKFKTDNTDTSATSESTWRVSRIILGTWNAGNVARSPNLV